MVKIDIDREKKFTMETTKKMEKIQIYPSKQQHNSFNNKIKPKLIMSPLTTMPTNAKKLMIAANGIQMKQQSATNNMHTTNENNMNNNKKEDNHIVKLPTDKIMKENSMTSVNVIPSMSMNDKQPETTQENSSLTTTVVNIEKSSNERNKETAGYRLEKEKITLGDVHPYITCFLCKGYLIEATTIVECLHTYCHSCLMKHLSREKCCPQCEMSINKSKTNIKYDATIQSIVYKLVPGLYEKELLRRRAFYKQRPDEAKLATPEERGDDTEHLIFSPSDLMSLSIDYAEKETLKGMESDPHVQNLLKPRFLNCPAIFKVEHLKKFILNKFNINVYKFNVEISYKVKTIVLPEHYTLMDVAYIYTWKKEAPMPFFFRIIAKNSKCNELPEVSLRRSPTNLPNLNDDLSDSTSTNASSKKKSVSFKEDVESSEIKAVKDVQKASNVSNGGNGMSNVGGKKEETKKLPPPPQQQPRVESIKLKFDVSNNNVSIIKPDGTTVKTDTKSRKKDKESKKASKYDNSNFIIENKSATSLNEKKDEYEFDDEIEKQKLGFLNTFQLTAKKMLLQKNSNLLQNNNNNNNNNSSNSNSSKSSDNKITSVTKKDENVNSKNIEEGKNLTQKSTSENNNSNASKRKSKEPVKAEKAKKYKFHEMKSVSEGSKFLFTKTGDGHEITFDMSPKPLGSKPPLSKVKSDILMAQQRADAKAIQSKNDIIDKVQTTKAPQIKPKKLPMLLPKQPSQVSPTTQSVTSTTLIAPTAMSPTAFVIKKPDVNQKEAELSTTSEISVTKLNDSNHQYRVFGPSSPENTSKEKESTDIQFKSPRDVFAQPLPPKTKSPSIPPTTPVSSSSSALKPFGFSPKQPKSIPENMQTPYGSRTPFYVPSSPSYTPNFDLKPQFKYANPNAYASFMQSMFCSPQPDKISSPINASQSSSKIPSAPTTNDAASNSRKRPSIDAMPAPSKRKTPSPTKTNNTNTPTSGTSSVSATATTATTTTASAVSVSSPTNNTSSSGGDTEAKTFSILNKINFPSSLSVTLTNEQEENKKEQLRNQKQNVNNNIEIIKISDEKELAAKNSAKSPSPPKNSTNTNCNNNNTNSNSNNANEKPENVNEKQQIAKKLPELKKLAPILPAAPNVSSMPPPPISILPPPAVAKALSDSKESFQRAFLESLMSVTNRDKNMDNNKTSHRKKDGKSQSTASPDVSKNKNQTDLESKSELKKNSNNQDNVPTAATPKKNLSLTPPLTKNNSSNNNNSDKSTNSTSSLTPPPMMLQDHSLFSPQAVAASSAVQFNLMLNALNAAAATGGGPFAFPDYAANIQRSMLLETLRKNVEKSNALLAMHHQLQQQQQQQQQNQKTSPNSSSSSSKH